MKRSFRLLIAHQPGRMDNLGSTLARTAQADGKAREKWLKEITDR
ncbi:MAG: hypothetical protein QMD73_07730 [Rhodocyclaceae bacterium]|nr:hypothetical protein [Rhodocyclaceae bacterium]